MDQRDGIRTALDYAKRYIEFQHRYHPYVGTQIAVRVDGDLELNEAFGLADLEAEQPMTVDHLFRIASHSKTFTGVACLQLRENGKLGLDDRAGTHVPEIDGSPMGEVTVRELLGHGSGMIRDGEDCTFWSLRRDFPDRAELIETIRSQGKVIEANEEFKYSNIGYSLLGLIIESASGMTYRDYVQSHIVDAIGMPNTGPDIDMGRIDDYAPGYTARSTGTRRPIEHIDTGAESAATGFYSKASELTDYFQAHLDGDERILKDSSKRLMRQAQWRITDRWSYGLGLSQVKVGDRTYYGHGGGYPGHITMSRFDPERRLSISVLTNTVDGPATVICDAVLGLVDLALAEKKKTEPRRAEELARFEGRFADLWAVVDVVNLGGRLFAMSPVLSGPADEAMELEVVSDTELRIVAGVGSIGIHEPVKYTFDDDGRVREVSINGSAPAVPLDELVLPDVVRRP